LYRPEHPTYCSIERKNGIHNNCVVNNEDVGFSVTLNKKLAKKVDGAISYSPNCDGNLLLYLLICEGKKSDYFGYDSYDKLIRCMNDCCNSWIIYYCKKAEQLSKKLIEQLKKIKIFGLHIYGKFVIFCIIIYIIILLHLLHCLFYKGGNCKLLIYDQLCEGVGRIRLANEVQIPLKSEKNEAPYCIEVFWQIKVIKAIILMRRIN